MARGNFPNGLVALVLWLGCSPAPKAASESAGAAPNAAPPPSEAADRPLF